MNRWYLLLLTGVLCISTSAILITLAAAPPTVAAFYRNFFAALIWLIPFFKTRPFTPALFQRNNKKYSPVCLFAILGLLFAADLWAWHRCIIALGAGPATLLGNIQVLIVALLALFFFGEKLKKYYWPGCLLALTGIAMLTLTKGIGQSVVIGLLLGLFTALTYSFFLIILKLLNDYLTTPRQILFWVAFFTTIFLLVPLFLEGESLALATPSLLWLLLHAFVSSVAGWWLIIKAIDHLPVSIASALLLLQPILTSIWGEIFLGQNLSLVQISGIILAVGGIRLAVR